MEKTLIWHMDCTIAPDVKNYFEVGKTTVVDSPIGRYRETPSVNLCRFGYRFSLRDITKPHLMQVIYPDDKNRFICINDGTTYDLTFGLLCGMQNKPSGKMLTAENIFWGRFTDETVVISSWGDGQPAAVSEIFVYELDELPDAKIETKPGFRRLGMQYEDPCNIGTSEGVMEHGLWAERVISYMKYTGQSTLTYPVNWYHGPIVPVESQPYERFNTLVMPNRKQYIRSTQTPTDWLDPILTRFDEEGLKFSGGLTLMRLGNLLRDGNRDKASVIAGADTWYNVTGDGSLQTFLNDWTGTYNSIIFPHVASEEEYSYAYGECQDSVYHGAMFNPLHSEVRRQILTYFGELADRYAHHPSFTGLTIQFWQGTFLWYGSLFAGYDDYSIGMFTTENSLEIPVAVTDPQRFTKRYEWIQENCLELFIGWRCEKIREFLLEVRDTLVCRRVDLTLTLNIWNETSAVKYMDRLSPEEQQFGARGSNYQLYRELGLDLAQMAHEPNIEISVEHNSMRDMSEPRGCNVPPELAHMYSDYSFLDAETNQVLDASDNSTTFLSYCWVEAWGKHRFFRCDDNDPNLEIIRNLPDYRSNFVMRENSTYDDETETEDGLQHSFWYDSQLRITPALPAGVYYGELMAEELAAHDTLQITCGGIHMDKAHAEAQRTFVKAYSMLPKQKFKSVEGCSDPVTVRYLPLEEITYVYAVNREPYALEITLNCGEMQEMIAVAPFGLEVRVYAGNIQTVRCCVDIKGEFRQAYSVEWEPIYTQLTEAWKYGIEVPGCREIAEKITAALSAGHLSFVRHALHSYPIEKTLQRFRVEHP